MEYKTLKFVALLIFPCLEKNGCFWDLQPVAKLKEGYASPTWGDNVG